MNTFSRAPDPAAEAIITANMREEIRERYSKFKNQINEAVWNQWGRDLIGWAQNEGLNELFLTIYNCSYRDEDDGYRPSGNLPTSYRLYCKCLSPVTHNALIKISINVDYAPLDHCDNHHRRASSIIERHLADMGRDPRQLRQMLQPEMAMHVKVRDATSKDNPSDGQISYLDWPFIERVEMTRPVFPKIRIAQQEFLAEARSWLANLFQDPEMQKIMVIAEDMTRLDSEEFSNVHPLIPNISFNDYLASSGWNLEDMDLPLVITSASRRGLLGKKQIEGKDSHWRVLRFSKH